MHAIAVVFLSGITFTLAASNYKFHLDSPNYEYGYRVYDSVKRQDFGHEEVRKMGRTNGMYYVLLPDGRKQTVKYFANDQGYFPVISYDKRHSERLPNNDQTQTTVLQQSSYRMNPTDYDSSSSIRSHDIKKHVPNSQTKNSYATKATNPVQVIPQHNVRQSFPIIHKSNGLKINQRTNINGKSRPEFGRKRKSGSCFANNYYNKMLVKKPTQISSYSPMKPISVSPKEVKSQVNFNGDAKTRGFASFGTKKKQMPTSVNPLLENSAKNLRKGKFLVSKRPLTPPSSGSKITRNQRKKERKQQNFKPSPKLSESSYKPSQFYFNKPSSIMTSLINLGPNPVLNSNSKSLDINVGKLLLNIYAEDPDLSETPSSEGDPSNTQQTVDYRDPDESVVPPVVPVIIPVEDNGLNDQYYHTINNYGGRNQSKEEEAFSFLDYPDEDYL